MGPVTLLKLSQIFNAVPVILLKSDHDKTLS